MKPCADFVDVKKHSIFRNKRGATSNTIYTFDIETTSLFNHGDGWQVFDYSKPPEYYRECEKVGVMWVWQFGVNDTVYYGRTWDEFTNLLVKLSNPLIKKVVYVHNLKWEFQFLTNLIVKHGWSISHLLARKARTPITFTIDELNIQFRCSYCLTNLSLEKAGEKYTTVKKAVGDLDYNKARGYLTDITPDEHYYCEMDCIVLYHIIKHFRAFYGSVERIPYTQTGEVRRAFSQVASQTYQNRVRKLHEDVPVYVRLMQALSGGLCHTNRIHACNTYYNVGSFDFSSSYPASFCYKYPMSRFTQVNPKHASIYKHDNFAILYTVEYINLECKYYNAYLPSYKAMGGVNIRADGGRIFKADKVKMILTDVDFDVVNRAYKFSQLNIIEMFTAVKDYLPRHFLNFMMDLYEQKTALKGIAGREHEYARAKERINALYGANVFSIAKSGATFDPKTGEWNTPPINNREYIQTKLDEQRNAYTHLFTYSWGVWCTAIARSRLYNMLITANYETDRDSLYYDTDSDKMLNWKKHLPIIDNANEETDRVIMEMCKARDIDFERTRPKDKNGKSHPLGYLEFEGEYKIFRACGAKRYAYEEQNGTIHTVVSGVSKKDGYKALKGNIENFKDGLLFDYDECGKLISNYNDDQPAIIFKDYEGKTHFYNDKFGICMQPTTYEMGLTSEYEALIEWAQENINKVKAVKN